MIQQCNELFFHKTIRNSSSSTSSVVSKNLFSVIYNQIRNFIQYYYYTPFCVYCYYNLLYEDYDITEFSSSPDMKLMYSKYVFDLQYFSKIASNQKVTKKYKRGFSYDKTSIEVEAECKKINISWCKAN